MRSFSIDEWCALHGISRPFFYKLESQGNGPQTFHIGRNRRISEQDNIDWIAAMKAAVPDQEVAAKYSAIGRKAVGSRKDRQTTAQVQS